MSPRVAGVLTCGILACSPAPEPIAPVPALQPQIEPSEPDAPRRTLGEGDEEAQRCFRRAASLDPDGAARCRDAEVDACNDLARSIAGDAPVCAAKLRELACDAEHARSCADLATQLRAQPNQQTTRVRTLLERACQGRVATACTQYGEMEAERLGRHDATALPWLQKGCELGDGEGCFLAYDHGRGQSAAARASMIERGCELGHDGACLRFGFSLFTGLGGAPRDPVRGEQVLGRVCEGTSEHAGEACFMLGRAVATAQSTYFAKACKKGHFNACLSILVEHHSAGRRAEAIALATDMLQKDPNQWRVLWIRASALFNTGKHAAAIPDLEALIPLRPDWPLMQIWLYAARGRSGGDGKAALETAFAAMDKTAWPAPIFKFMLGQSSQAKLLRAARDKNAHKQKQQECEAFYYLGQHLMVRGKTSQAKAMFQKSVDTQITDYIEFTGAQAELSMFP